MPQRCPRGAPELKDETPETGTTPEKSKVEVWFITPITMVYGTQITIVTGAYKSTNITGGLTLYGCFNFLGKTGKMSPALTKFGRWEQLPAVTAPRHGPLFGTGNQQAPQYGRGMTRRNKNEAHTLFQSSSERAQKLNFLRSV